MKIFLTILTVIWMIVIFLFSNSPADESSDLSNSFMKNTIVKIVKVFKKDLNEEEFMKKMSTPIRKLAHFTEYMILGVLLFLTLKQYGIDNKWIVILGCMIYASTDEIHQLFIEGRTGRILDVFIDTIGSSFGVFITVMINKIFH